MKSNTEFNKYKVKNDELYLPKSGGKVEGEAIFTGGVRFSSGDPKNDLVIKDKRSLGTATGHEYHLEFNTDLDEVTLTEDSQDKTTLPLVATYVGTRADWNLLSAAEQAQYRIVHFTDEWGSIFSHVGQIIESTTLDTEAKVKAVYGASTSWIQHTGYMLRGATSGVVANQASNDGGVDSVEVSSVASHNHTQNEHSHAQHTATRYNLSGNYYSPNNGGQWNTSYNEINTNNIRTQNTTATNIANGSNYTVNTLPKYKNVYIWERVS